MIAAMAIILSLLVQLLPTPPIHVRHVKAELTRPAVPERPFIDTHSTAQVWRYDAPR